MYSRKLKPPKPELKILTKLPLSVKFPLNEEGKDNVNDWTFIESQP